MSLQLIAFGAIGLFLVFLFYLVLHYKKNYSHWSKSGLPYVSFPRDCVFYPAHKSLTFQKFYNELAPHRLGGIHKMSRPFLLIRDPELVRRILITDFSYFTGHGRNTNDESDPLNSHIFNLEGERWRSIRQKLNPVFSMTKLKGMRPLMVECENELTKYLDHLIESGGQFDVHDTMRKFAMDVIGTCAFGIKCDAIQKEDCEFRRLFAGSVLKSSYRYFFRSLLRSTDLKIMSLFMMKKINERVNEFFFSLVRECTKLRVANADQRKDIMQHLINLQREEQEQLKKDNSNTEPLITDTIVAAQAYVFFLAGHETTAGTLSFLLYELALNPDIMEKCRAEVTSVLERYEGIITYDSLKDLTFIQCAIDETLRKYPLAGWLERMCEKDYELPDNSYIVKRNTRLVIPTYALHHDPKYYPEPHRFIPDRFEEENKHNIVPGTYLPFGDGPRICIGMRFAMMEMKAAIASIVMKYDITPSEKTEIPLTFEPLQILLTPVNGIMLRLSKRKVAI